MTLKNIQCSRRTVVWLELATHHRVPLGTKQREPAHALDGSAKRNCARAQCVSAVGGKQGGGLRS